MPRPTAVASWPRDQVPILATCMGMPRRHCWHAPGKWKPSVSVMGYRSRQLRYNFLCEIRASLRRSSASAVLNGSARRSHSLSTLFLLNSGENFPPCDDSPGLKPRGFSQEPNGIYPLAAVSRRLRPSLLFIRTLTERMRQVGHSKATRFNEWQTEPLDAKSFTRENDLSRNRQTLIRCQCAENTRSIPSCNTPVNRVYLRHGNKTNDDAAHPARQASYRDDQATLRMSLRHSSDTFGDQDGSQARGTPRCPSPK